MRNKKIKLAAIILIVAAVGAFYFFRARGDKSNGEIVEEIRPSLGDIDKAISSTGTVLPRNRLEIMPPVSGRIEEILVKEGDLVSVGQILARMSSTERAALLDAARGKSEEDYKYWQEVYKAIPLVAPIEGEVIVATTQPGQTVSASDAVVVLSDQLIVRAQVDETDIGKIRIGQNAEITLDAYPDKKIKAKVEHIYYESETVNNVTIYKVDLIPEEAPEYFRSGMNTTVDFKVEEEKGVLLIPVEAVHQDGDESYVFLREPGSQAPVRRAVKLGITDDKNYAVLSGINADDTILLTTQEYVFPGGGDTSGSNPFLPKMPSRKRR